MIIDLVGENGTILMNTESAKLSRLEIKKIWAGKNSQFVFQINAPTGRGIIAEFFRRRKGTIRSYHPFYNAAAYGKKAKDMKVVIEEFTTLQEEYDYKVENPELDEVINKKIN